MNRHPVYRLDLVTLAHLGAAAGEAVVDRPTQVDALEGLPFLPGSAVKGVLAGRHGDVPDTPGDSNPPRERLYGSPDRGTERGRPADFVLGDGHLLGFPLPAELGGGFAVPATAAARLAYLLGFSEALREPLATLAGLPTPSGSPGPSPGPLDTLAAWLRGLAGWPDDQPLLFAPGKSGRQLWLQAAERRTGTALDPGRRVVRDASLRTVELVPAGSVFLARATRLGEEAPEEIPLQVGAWESLGLGWLEMTAVADLEPRPPRPESAGGAGPAPAGTRAGDPLAAALRPAPILRAAWQAVEALPAAEPKLRTAARAATFNFGPRARLYGFEAALAFSLARAKPHSRRPTADNRAHRWLLGALLGLGEALHREPAACAPLAAWLAGDPFSRPTDLRASEPEGMARWLWLRRYAEVCLDKASPAPATPLNDPQ